MKLTGKKFLLLLLYAPDSEDNYNIPIAGRTRLMKMGFLFDKELRSEFEKDRNFDEIKLPEYFAWKYGPFSIDLLNDLEFLVNQGYIKREKGTTPPLAEELAEYSFWIDDFENDEYEEEIFQLISPKGIEKGKEFWEIMSAHQRVMLIEFKSILNAASLNRILEYVYKKYKKDGYTDKSLIKERFLK